MLSMIECLAVEGNELSTEATQTEFEFEIYLEGYDLEEIKSKANRIEEQEQWGIHVPKSKDNGASGSIRVRKITRPGEEPMYVMTTKTDAGDVGRKETEQPVDSCMFDEFEKLSTGGLKKTRYFVEHQTANGTEFVFEVDVFFNLQGEAVPWVKIDAEVSEGIQLTPDDIPFTRSDIIMVSPGNKPKELTERIRELYDTYFQSKTKYAQE